MSLGLLIGASGCQGEKAETIPPATEVEPSDTPSTSMPSISIPSASIPSASIPSISIPSISIPTPSIDDKVYTLSEAKDICSSVELSYKDNFIDKEISIRGKLIYHYAMPGSYHFMMMADNEIIFPVLIPSNSRLIKKYHVGKSYEIKGNVGSYRNLYTIRAMADPKESSNINVSLDNLAVDSSINDIYNSAYSLEIKENNSTIANSLYKVSATYVSKINDNLMMIFDGEKHIILHGPDKLNNGFTKGMNYSFYVFPSVSQGKKSAEYVDSKCLNTLNEGYLADIKAKAISMNVDDISRVDRYNDNKKLYPNIIKLNSYVMGLDINDNTHICLADYVDSDPKWTQANKNPKVVFIKNHVLNDSNCIYSKLTAYYNHYVNGVNFESNNNTDEALVEYEMAKGDFYIIISEYQSELHAYQAFMLDDLTMEIE